MPAGTYSRGITLTGLLAMIALLLLPMPTAWTGTVAVPLVVLFVTGLKPPRKWGGWIAVMMVPYFAIALGEAIANPSGRLVAGLLASCAFIVFFSALDFSRRIGVNFRS